MGKTLLSFIIPGLGLLGTRRWRTGLVLPIISVVLIALGAVTALASRNALLSIATDHRFLTVLWIGLAVFGLMWVIALIATHLLTRPRPAARWQRILGSMLVGTLAFGVAAPTFVAARTVYDTSSLIREVFQDDSDPGGVADTRYGNVFDPWANKPRLNVLILGGDAGPDRVGTRTDTVMVASINTRTGDTVLYSLPRQTLRLPFPKGTPLHRLWPNGFYLPGEDELESAVSSMYDNVPNLAPKAIPPSRNPGAKVLQIAVGEALGLSIDFYTMVNLDGFVELVDALGGITVNINRPVPVGGKNASGASAKVPPDRWLAPGPNQHLNGFDALWYARGRYETTDYERMSRQRCVIQAITQQVNLGTVLTNYEALTKAGKNIVSTDVPNSLLPAMIDLAARVRSQPLRAVSFEHGVDGFSTTHPSWTKVRVRVRESQDPPPPALEPVQTEDPTPTPTPGKKITPTPSPTPDAGTNVADECAYDPTAWPATTR